VKKGVAELVARISPTIRLPAVLGSGSEGEGGLRTVSLKRERKDLKRIKTDFAERLAELAEQKKKVTEIHHAWLDTLAFIRRPEHSNEDKTGRVKDFLKKYSQDNPFQHLATNHLAALKLAGTAGGDVWSFSGAVDDERYTVSEDAAFDTETGLMWQRRAPDTMMSWKEGVTYCRDKANKMLEGKKWRLPRRDELESLRAGRAAAAGCYWAGTVFEGVCALYWSGTLDIFSDNSGFAVSFGSNRVDSIMTEVRMPVRCVTDEFSR